MLEATHDEHGAGIGGPFVSLDNPGAFVDVEFGSVTVGLVPLPAAAWFLLSGLGALFGVRRHART